MPELCEDRLAGQVQSENIQGRFHEHRWWVHHIASRISMPFSMPFGYPGLMQQKSHVHRSVTPTTDRAEKPSMALLGLDRGCCSGFVQRMGLWALHTRSHITRCVTQLEGRTACCSRMVVGKRSSTFGLHGSLLCWSEVGPPSFHSHPLMWWIHAN